MSKQVEFFFDVGSPASYLAWTQLPSLCDKAGAELVYRPMLLGAVFQATGNASPAAVPAKAMHSLVDLTRHAKRYGVPFQFNGFFPINTLTLMRALVGAQLHTPDRFKELLTVVFKAMWVEGLNLGDPAVVGPLLAGAGFDPQALLDQGNAPDVKAALRQNTDEAVARGVFGAPTLFVGSEMFFGQDRLDFVREALQG